MNSILITNVGNSYRNTLICDTELDSNDIWIMLTDKQIHFDEIKTLDKTPTQVPENTSIMWFTPRGEYDFQRELVSKVPELAGYYPPWEELHPKKKARR